MAKPNCTQCKHFYVTWDPQKPNGCRQFGIQCKPLPSQIVASAGMGECEGFVAKAKKTQETTDRVDLSDRKYW